MNIDRIYELCVKKFENHMKCFKKAGEYGGQVECGDYYEEGKFNAISNRFNWMTSFITGFAPLYYETEKDSRYLIWANQFQKEYHKKVFETPLETMHDLGFLYLYYSVPMYDLTGDKSHRDDALKAADELVKRFDINGHYIDAWSRMDDDEREGRAIIDCMINIQLLFWAWKETGYTIYRDVAKAHADTTIKHFIRDNYSVRHSVLLDRKTGELIKESNCCGFADGSYWARGTAWAIYGLAMTAANLNDSYYYDLAVKLLRQYLKQKFIDKCIPVWDFRLPKEKPAYCANQNIDVSWDEIKEENCIYNVDTSAAVIVCCGIVELCKYKYNEELFQYVSDTLKLLCTEEYMNFSTDIPGILKKQNGQMVYTTCGDYYFAVLTKSYKNIVKNNK